MTIFSMPATPLAPSAGASNPLNTVFEQTTNLADTPSFAQTLESAFGQTNALQSRSADMAQAFAQGKTSDIHSVMVASEQASLALQLTTQIRNKAVDAYQEIMRISM